MAWLLVTEEEAAELAAGRVPADVRECARQLRDRSEKMPERKGMARLGVAGPGLAGQGEAGQGAVKPTR